MKYRFYFAKFNRNFAERFHKIQQKNLIGREL